MDNTVDANEQLDGVKGDMSYHATPLADNAPLNASIGLNTDSAAPARGTVFGLEATWSNPQEAEVELTVTGVQNEIPVYGATWTHSAKGSPWTVWLTLDDAAEHVDSALPIAMKAELTCQGTTQATLNFKIV